KCWQGGVITPMGHFTGNVIMFALPEMVVFLGILMAILSKAFWPSIAPAALAMLVYGVNYPHGGPMFGQADPASINVLKPTPEPVAAQNKQTNAAGTSTES